VNYLIVLIQTIAKYLLHVYHQKEKHSSQSIENRKHLHRKLMKKISRPVTIIIPFDSIAKVTKREKINLNQPLVVRTVKLLIFARI
jgi:hypothetical protein